MDCTEQVKSSEDHQDDMMTMMMMMQLPEFSSPANSDGFESYGATANNNNTRPLADLIDSSTPWSNPSSTLFTSQIPSTTISFANHTPNNQQTLFPPGATNYPCCGTTPSEKRNSPSSSSMKEMIFRIAVMQPINIDPESVKAPKRRNVKISKDPQSIAARHRRERISERIRILQRMVPGGTKMDTASMLDEAIHYVKFLKTQVQSLELVTANNRSTSLAPNYGTVFPLAMSSSRSAPSAILTPTPYFSLPKPYQARNLENYGDA